VTGRRSLFGIAMSVAYSLRKVKPGAHLLDVGGGLNVELDGLGPREVFITLVHGYAFPDSLSGLQAIGTILVGLTVSAMGDDALERIATNEAQMRRSGELLT
jgi:hypothetical protein